MTSDDSADDVPGYGTEVVLDNFDTLVDGTRMLRLALDVLEDNVPAEADNEQLRQALWKLRGWLSARELRKLRTWGLARQFVIICPINPRTPPGPDDMKRIATAIRTLDDLGLIVKPDE